MPSVDDLLTNARDAIGITPDAIITRVVIVVEYWDGDDLTLHYGYDDETPAWTAAGMVDYFRARVHADLNEQ